MGDFAKTWKANNRERVLAYAKEYNKRYRATAARKAKERKERMRERITAGERICLCGKPLDMENIRCSHCVMYHREYSKSESYKEKKRKYEDDNKERIAEYKRKHYAKYRQDVNRYKIDMYHQGAKARNITWELTDEEAINLFSQNCYYCGSIGGGIDRMDSDIHYKIDNVVPCCTQCNYMKNDKSDIIFKAVCSHISKFSGYKGDYHPLFFIKSKKPRVCYYKRNAKKRNMNWNLSDEDFNLLINDNCTYCGVEKCSGVDRIDSSLGYCLDNCTPCCRTCNVMKMCMPADEFIQHCVLVANYERPINIVISEQDVEIINNFINNL